MTDMNIQPVVLGEGKHSQQSVVLFRWASTDDLAKLAQGIHLPNEHMRKQYDGEIDVDHTYFTSLGDGSARTP